MEPNATIGNSIPSTLPNYSFSDILGILAVLLGFLAIGLAIYSYRTQNDWNAKIKSLADNINKYVEKQKKIEDSIRIDSLAGINALTTESIRHLMQMIQRLTTEPSNNILQIMLNNVGYQRVLLVNSESIIRFANNLKFLEYELHKQIEMVGMRLQHLSNPEEFEMKIPDYYQSWMGLAQTTINEMNSIQEKMKKS